MKWGASRAPAAPPHSFRIVSAILLHLRRVLSQCPSSTQTLEKQSDLVGLGPSPNFPFFPFFLCTFRFWGRRVSEETVPQHSVCGCVCVCVFSCPSSRPKLKATHPKRPNAQWKMQSCKLIVAVGSPPKLSINAEADVLCVSTEATGRSGQRTEALRATPHAGQAWTAIKGFDLVCTHKPDRSCKSMTGVCTGCKQWHPVVEGGDQLDHQ